MHIMRSDALRPRQEAEAPRREFTLRPSIWVRLRVVGFDAYGVRFARPVYLECGARSTDLADWHFTTQLLRAWIGTERDARPLIRAAADSCEWDFDLAMEVGDELLVR
jgi:hypothetical protein